MTHHRSSFPQPHARQRGLATISAVMLLAVVAAAVTAMSWQFSADASRTRRMRQEAELDQMLQAGITMAIERSRSARPLADGQATQLPLPPGLATDAAVTLTPEMKDDRLIIHVDARRGELRQSTNVTFIKRGNDWRLEAVTTVEAASR